MERSVQQRPGENALSNLDMSSLTLVKDETSSKKPYKLLKHCWDFCIFLEYSLSIQLAKNDQTYVSSSALRTQSTESRWCW